MLKRIPKKTTATKVRLIDIDLDKVPVTSTISLDTETHQTKPIVSTVRKRASNETNEVPQKKPKINSTTSTIQNIKKKIPITSKIAENSRDHHVICLFLFRWN
jgi:hypothetical protein